jgi:hypothetical protein
MIINYENLLSLVIVILCKFLKAEQNLGYNFYIGEALPKFC